MKFLYENWSLIVAIGAALSIAYMRVRAYMQLSKEEQDAKLKEHRDKIAAAVAGWALKGVIDAEKDLGSGTGKLKVAAAYEKAMELFGAELADVMTLDQFNQLIQGPLAEMRKLLENNGAVSDYIEGR